MECALGQSPFPKLQNVFDFMNYINKSPIPQLPKDKFSPGFIDFVMNCLIPSSINRPNVPQMRVLFTK
jgi:serine/threonine protein kinase